jgi:hypothetical protein
MEIEKWRAETGARGRFAPESLEWLLAQDRVDDILTDDLVGERLRWLQNANIRRASPGAVGRNLRFVICMKCRPS